MLPNMLLIHQNRPAATPIADIPQALRSGIAAAAFDPSRFSGQTVGIAVGSRGIDRIDRILCALVELIRHAGGTPVLFAAMGCHGEASAQGQREMLRSLSIAEDTVHAPIRTGAQAVFYGVTASGIPVYGNPLALEFDQLVLVNRIKPHTDFEDITESGLLKLLAIGVGNPAGCRNVHAHALRLGYGRVIRETAAVMLERLPVVLGIMLTENWKHQLDRLEAVLPERFPEREQVLLRAVKEQTIRLPAARADVLLVGQIGKNISGTGMDTKVIGRIGIIGQKEPDVPRIGRIVVLDLTEASHGNAIGIGLADLSTMAVHDKINLRATAINACSSMSPEQGRLPCFLSHDEEAITAAVETLGLEDPAKAHILYIQDTNTLEYLAVSEPLYRDVLSQDPCIQPLGNPFPLRFDESGALLQRWKDGRLSPG